MSGGKGAVGRELAAFFERYKEEGFPPDVNERLEEFELSPAAVALLRSGDTKMIEKYVGLNTPMIFWPPGGV
jgi:hypothetical protein